MFLKEIAEKKVVARGKRKMESRNGSKSTIRYHIELGHAVDSSCGHIETWRHTRWDEENGWISQEMAAKYVSLVAHFYLCIIWQIIDLLYSFTITGGNEKAKK